MKTEHDMIKKALSASLSVVYFFIALTYIQFLPNYTARSLDNEFHRTNRLTAEVYANVNSSHAVLQKFFKSTPENKRDLAAAFFHIAVLAGSLIAAAFVACRLILQSANNPFYAVTQSHVYLQYRSLRI